MSQGSVLWPLLFIILIDHIDDGILSKISEFVDDTKLCKAVANETLDSVRGSKNIQMVTEISSFSKVIPFQVWFHVDVFT